jgi:hypothetical protein
MLVSAAILLAAGIELGRGYKFIIVFTGCATFLIVGNLTVYLAGSKERDIRRRQRRDFYAGKI